MAFYVPAKESTAIATPTTTATAVRGRRMSDSEIATLEQRGLLRSGLAYAVAFSLGSILAWLGLLDIPFNAWIIALALTVTVQGALWWASDFGWHRRSGLDRHFVFTPLAAAAGTFIVYMWLAPQIRWLILMLWFVAVFFVTGRAGLRSIVTSATVMTLGYGALAWSLVQQGRALASYELAVGLFFWGINVYGAAIFERLRNRHRADRRDFEQIYELTQDLICKVDRQGLLRSVNPAFRHILGYDASELLNQPLIHFAHPADREATEQYFESLDRGETLGTFENRCLCRDGTHRWFSWLSFAKPGEDQLYAVGRDITARKEAETALRESEESLAEARRMVHLGAWTFHIPQQRLEWSDEMYRILGLSASDYTPSPKASWKLIAVTQRAQVRRLLFQTLRRRGSCVFEVSIGRADGQRRIVQSRAKVLTDPTGRPVKILGSVLDITEHSEARDALARSNRAKGDLLANVSHEIRTPLNGILGVASLLLKEDLKRTTRTYVETIRNSGEGLLTIIDDILDLSKIEAGRLELESIPFPLHRTVKQVMELLRPKALEKGLDLKSQIQPGIAQVLHGDPTRLRQILLNLLANAIKFTAQGAVELHITKESEDGDQVLLTFAVRDTGIGISPTAQNQLFQPFVQAEVSTARKYGGTGLGLAISRRLVELCGGQLSVQSTPGQGSTFRFSLPYAQHGRPPSTSEAKPRPSKTLSYPQRQAHCILVAEDEAINRMVITELLATLGYRAQAVDNGYGVLEALARMDFSAILMDCQMPHLDGFETTRRIRQQKSTDIPIIAMTAHAMAGDRDRCLAVGMDDYLPKPFNEGRLARTLDRWIGGVDTAAAFDGAVSDGTDGTDAALDEVPQQAHIRPPAGEAEDTPPKAIDPDAPAIHRPSLEALMGSGSANLMKSAAEIFLRQGPEKLAAMQSCFDADDLEALGRLAHGMAGTSGFVGAIGLSERCRWLEEVASRGDVEATAKGLDEIRHLCQRVAVELRTILDETSASPL